MAKIQCKAQVVSVEKLQEGIFSMWLEVPEIASQAAAGQFISLYCKSEDKLLTKKKDSSGWYSVWLDTAPMNFPI